MTPPLVYGKDCTVVGLVGGKAAALAVLSNRGFDVPPFVTVSPAAFDEHELTDAGRAAVVAAVSGLGTGPFAVRSSGRDEDGASHSHAGQFLSVLGVTGEDVPNACVRVWRSGLTESLRAYRTSLGLDPDGGAPAVIVQRMVKSRVAGVAFSADPASGRRDRIVVSAVAGLGDRLVGGEADGDDYTLDKADDIPFVPSAHGVMSVADLGALRDAVMRIEVTFGCPQDVEWAFEGTRLYLLQARPITSALRPAPIADQARLVFDNSNIVESYPGLVSPLTYSFACYVYARVYRMFVRIVGVDEETIRAHASTFENMLARIDGRVYYNLINWYRALALLPGFSLNRGYMEQMMGVASPLPAEVADGLLPPRAAGLARLREWSRIARVALRLTAAALRLERSIAAFNARMQSALARSASDIDAMPLSELAAEYRRIESNLLDRWDAPLVNDFLCMMAFGASRKLMGKWVGTGALELHNDIMIGQGDIVSAEPARRIAAMGTIVAQDPTLAARLASGDRGILDEQSELARDIRSYIEKFGDRCTEELKLESRTLEEEPAPLLTAIAASARGGARARATRADPLAELAARLGSRPLKRALTLRLVRWAKSRVRDRENLRFERTRIFGRARRVFLAMGRQFQALALIDEERDVFFLTVQEVIGAIEGSGLASDFRGLVRLRKAEQDAAAARPDPSERIEIRGAAASGSLRPDKGTPASADGGAVRYGTGCGAGSVVARARVVRNPAQDPLLPGEILIARHTDPGWIAVFCNASAIVVERGSLLSHSAIVARELGIPCVVGLKGATEWIATGDLLEVDGATGRVGKRNG